MKLTIEQIAAAVAEHGSIRAAARALGRDESVLRRRLRRAGLAPAAGRAIVEHDADAGRVTITAPSTSASTVEALIRENGLDPDDWIVVSTTLNKWDGPLKGGGTQPLRQVKVTLRRKPEDIFPTPAVHVPELVQPRPVRVSVDEPDLIVVEGDHQAPYYDPALDAVATRVVADLRPVEHVFLGDTLDLPTISRHDDHPAAMATVQECIDAGYALLRRRAEAAPTARRRKLKGNHDWRLESELLKRAERMYGIRPAGEDVPALSLRRLLQLDALGVELVEHPLGWEHAEVELVEGIAGLVVRHGWMTGHNTAGRSLAKRGRSLLVGHTHGREHVYMYDPSAGVERQAVVVGTMSLSRSRRFPSFAPVDAWLQGFATVTRWRDGRFMIEHARWDGEYLMWRDRRWEPGRT